ncbi:FkbM family methyltransferase, partial [Campylobacter jejuni]
MKHSVGNLFLEGQPIDVYMYGGFITLIQQTNSYALLHECFIKGSYFSYIKSNDIIDIGIGNGLSSFYLSKYTDKKLYCFEASNKVYDLFLESVKLNNKQEKIMSYNLAIGSKKQSVYVSNRIDNGNKTSLSIQSHSIFMDTIDNLVEELCIKPKMINIWVNGDE